MRQINKMLHSIVNLDFEESVPVQHASLYRSLLQRKSSQSVYSVSEAGEAHPFPQEQGFR